MMLRLWGEPGADNVANRCCTPDGVCRAIAVAEHLGIPFQLLNAESEFKAQVVDYLIAEYAAGRTPNPCVPCNRLVRFGWFLDRALESGAEFLATGHYARVTPTPALRQAQGKLLPLPGGGGSRYQLLRGRDSGKDQSYFLHTFTQAQLAHVLFPLGELTKRDVREIARQRGLPVAEQPESQDLCFLADGDYRRFLAEHVPHLFRPGPIRDTSGRVLGQHQGLPAYTIGQRKRLGLVTAQPLYVLALDLAENALVVGPASELGRDECRVEEMCYVSGETPLAPFRAAAQIRYRARPTAVTVIPLPHAQAHVRFDVPQRDLTPGQFLVLYEGEIVLGGGVICTAHESVL
jgi:tRNA-specific 2-thiouridylase